MDYLEVPVKILTDGTMSYRFVGPNDTKPDPAIGYSINSVPIEIEGLEGKFWLEYKITPT